MARSTYVISSGDDGRTREELWVLYEETTDSEGNPAACLVRVDDEGAGWEHVEAQLSTRQRAVIEEEIGLPLLEERAVQVEGTWRRVAYKHWARREWVGGKGWVYRRVVSVWNPERGTLEQAGLEAAPGEQFSLVLTEEEFQRLTTPLRALTAGERAEASCSGRMEREEARKALTSAPGTERVCRFVKRMDGSVRTMRFRYNSEQVRRPGFDAEAHGLLPVFDLDKQAPRFINLDGVLEASPRPRAAKGPLLARLS